MINEAINQSRQLRATLSGTGAEPNRPKRLENSGAAKNYKKWSAQKRHAVFSALKNNGIEPGSVFAAAGGLSAPVVPVQPRGQKGSAEDCLKLIEKMEGER